MHSMTNLHAGQQIIIIIIIIITTTKKYWWLVVTIAYIDITAVMIGTATS